MLGRYVLLNYIKTFLAIFIVLLGILYAYIIGEVLIVFKDKSLGVLFSYSLNLLPIVFFYISAFVSGLALLVSLRRFLQKKIDLLSQSFGISPLAFSQYLILFSLFLSLLNLLGSYSLYAKNQKNLYRIEKEHKKAKKIERGIVRNLWLIEEKNGKKSFYQFGFVDTSTGRIHGFYRLSLAENSIRELITADSGLWEEENIKLKDARIKNLLTGEEAVKDINIDYINLSHIEPLAEKLEHLPMKDLFSLSLLGKEIGVNQRFYLYELLRRASNSTLSFFLVVITCWAYLRWRRFKVALILLIFFFSFHWLSFNLIRSLLENTNLNILLISLIYAPIPLISLKGLYDLGKGFRV